MVPNSYANYGYWQIPLDGDRQFLTTFNSPFGRYCFQRMPFGIKSVQEVFQKRITQVIGGLPGVETDIDDILVWGLQRQNMMNVLKLCYRGVKRSVSLLMKTDANLG